MNDMTLHAEHIKKSTWRVWSDDPDDPWEKKVGIKPDGTAEDAIAVAAHKPSKEELAAMQAQAKAENRKVSAEQEAKRRMNAVMDADTLEDMRDAKDADELTAAQVKGFKALMQWRRKMRARVAVMVEDVETSISSDKSWPKLPKTAEDFINQF